MEKKEVKKRKWKNWVKKAYEKSAEVFIKILPDLIGAIVKNLL